MFRKEDFESWNQLFPDCKIAEADLNHPTEAFLTRTLVSYLKSLGYKCESPFEKNDSTDNSQAKRLFLKNLAKHIDGIYKITDINYSFHPYDLIRPTPKKTSHLLGILLNYLFYYNMYKSNIFEAVNEAAKEQMGLKKLISNEANENQELAMKVEQCKDEIDQISKELPQIKSESSRLGIELGKKKTLSHEMHADIEELKKTFTLLEEEKFNLEKIVVPENQIRTVETDMETLNGDIESLKQQAEKYEAIIKDRNIQIMSMENLCKEISEAKLIIPPSTLEELKKSCQSLIEAENQLANEQAKEKEIHQSIDMTEKSIEELTIQSQTQKQDFEKENNEDLSVVQKLERTLNDLTKVIDDIQRQNDEMEENLISQNELHEFILENASDLLPNFLLDSSKTI